MLSAGYADISIFSWKTESFFSQTTYTISVYSLTKPFKEKLFFSLEEA